MLNKNVIKSTNDSNTGILFDISALHLNGKSFELDPTYSKGAFYKDFPEPILKCDINPEQGVFRADCRNLRIANNSIESIIFDPPFMFGTHGKTKTNIMNKRFTMFDTFNDLKDMYIESIREFYRILKPKGVLAFKCQDYTDSKTTMTHCLVFNWAVEVGFYAKDLFILLSNKRIFNPKLKQRHARKFHCYWWVFQK